MVVLTQQILNLSETFDKVNKMQEQQNTDRLVTKAEMDKHKVFTDQLAEKGDIQDRQVEGLQANLRDLFAEIGS